MSRSGTDHKIPIAALLLGIGGLAPFFAAAASQWVTIPAVPPQFGVSAGITYGAVILSFLGGIRWGAALGQEPDKHQALQFGGSIMPSLVGWSTLLMPPPIGLIVLISGFLLQSLWDVLSVETGELPRWFGKLRMVLTIGAVLSLFLILLRVVISAS